MFRSTRIGRFLAAATLAVAATAVFAGSPAGAANTNLSVNCSTSNYSQSIGNSDTLTITITGSGCNGFIILDNPGSGAQGTATLNGFGLTAGNPIGVTGGDTVVYTAPASGAGVDSFTIVSSLQPITIVSSISITFPVPTPRTGDSMVDNGNGSMTITFAALTNSQTISVNFYPSGTTCPTNGVPTGRLFLLSSSSQAPVQMTSPAVISAGSPAIVVANGNPSVTTIAAGSYQACMNYFSGSSAPVLVQSLAVTLGEVTPDPVAPAFTG